MLLDIRVKSPFKNIVLIRGTQYEAPSVPLEGHVVFSLPEQMPCKKVSLKLVGTYKLDFIESVKMPSHETIKIPVRDEATVLECVWDNLLVSETGVITCGDYGQPVSSNSSRSNSVAEPSTVAPKAPPKRSAMKKRANAPGSLQMPSVSLSKYENVSTPSGSASFVLQKGNFSLDFNCILPGNIPETVEGLRSGSIVYQLEVCIERGSFKHHFTKQKYVRILRTLTAANFAHTETVMIENLWPQRVQYRVSVPKKAIPLGGSTAIDLLIIPLRKGLKLGKVTASISQQFSLRGLKNEFYEEEDSVMEEEIEPIPKEDSSLDQWSFLAHVKIPANLRTVHHDCDTRGHMIKVRHKLKLRIQLVNSDGHVSELRAKLPVVFYVNPQFQVYGRVASINNGKVHFQQGQQPLFDILPSTPGSPDEEEQDEDSAPPLYEKHVYDAIYDAVSRTVSPSPLAQSVDSYFNISPASASGTVSLSASRAMSPMGMSPMGMSPMGDMSPMVMSPGAMTPVGVSPNAKSPSLEVPSYDIATEGSVNEDDLSPMYEGPGADSELGYFGMTHGNTPPITPAGNGSKASLNDMHLPQLRAKSIPKMHKSKSGNSIPSSGTSTPTTPSTPKLRPTNDTASNLTGLMSRLKHVNHSASSSQKDKPKK